MRLTRIRMKNFLSHADTDLDLSAVRSVVFSGPTGSGKSSFIQAFLAANYGLMPGSKPDEYIKLGSYAMCGLPEALYPVRGGDGPRGRAAARGSPRTGGRELSGVSPPVPPAPGMGVVLRCAARVCAARGSLHWPPWAPTPLARGVGTAE